MTRTAPPLVPSVSPAMPVAEGNDTSVRRERTLMEILVSQVENRTNKTIDMMYQSVYVEVGGCYHRPINGITLFID